MRVLVSLEWWGSSDSWANNPRSGVEERVVGFRPTTILAVLGIAIAVGLLLEVIWIARHVLVWVLIALFLALALNPLVDWSRARA